jgi:pSer/pThr/pTyr-binding forkhead associated (FHA) protein
VPVGGPVTTVPRPPLGTLRFSTGTEVVLDRGVIVGRLVRTERFSADDLPHLVELPGAGDVSRNHLQVRLDGWDIWVVDLHSTNGTTVTRPGEPRRVIPAGEPVLITPGTEIDLACEVQCYYEVEAGC